MRRRRFLQVAGAGAAGAGLAAGGPAPAEEHGGDLFERLVRANDGRIPALLERQVTEPSRPWPGALRDEYGVRSAGGTAGLVQALVAALAAPGSRYQGSPEIAGRLSLAARALLALQHADGTIDLPTTNFHSPPDTAFVLEPVCASLSVLRRARPAVPPAERTPCASRSAPGQGREGSVTCRSRSAGTRASFARTSRSKRSPGSVQGSTDPFAASPAPATCRKRRRLMEHLAGWESCAIAL